MSTWGALRRVARHDGWAYVLGAFVGLTLRARREIRRIRDAEPHLLDVLR